MAGGGRYLKYSLVGVDGNAFAVLGYTAQVLRNEGMRDMISTMREEATSGDYSHLLAVCSEYIDKANKAKEG